MHDNLAFTIVLAPPFLVFKVGITIALINEAP